MGRASAVRFAEEGAAVVVADVNGENGRRVAESIGPRAVFEHVELRSLDSIQSLVDRTIERFGRIDALANVAAVYPSTHFMDTTPEIWELMIETNLRAVFFLSQAVARTMIEQGHGGAIVNVASGAAFRPVAGQAAYSATNGGVVAMTRTIANDLAPHRICADVVAPGHTASETVRAVLSDEDLKASGARLFGGRWMEPEEVAEAIVFLASDAARGMTGAIVNVNLGDYMPH